MTLNYQDVITYIKEFTLEEKNLNLFEKNSSTKVEYVEINK